MDTHNVIKSKENNNQDKNVCHLSYIEPSTLSRLLKTHGPLAMRHITQLLSEEIPQFQSMSSSKKRRMIMCALERGDEENQVLFQKIGWGLWQIEHVDPNVPFEQQRQLINSMNKKRKDSVSGETKLDANKSTTKKDTKHENVVNFQALLPSPKSVYIDEYALSVSSSDEEDEVLEDNQIGYSNDLKSQMPQNRRNSSTIYSIKRRTSSVVNRPDSIILQPILNSKMETSPSSSTSTTLLLPQKGHSLAKNHKRRLSSNKSKNINISENGNLYNHHHPPPHQIALQRVRSSSMSNESSLRTTLNYMVDSANPIINKHNMVNTRIAPLTSTSHFSIELGGYSVKEGDSNNSSTHTLDSDKSSDFLLAGKVEEIHSRSDDKSDTEEEDWKNMDPRTLANKPTEDTNQTNNNNNNMNTTEVANLLLSLK